MSNDDVSRIGCSEGYFLVAKGLESFLGHRNDQSAEAPTSEGRLRGCSPWEEKVLGTPYCGLSVPKGSL